MRHVLLALLMATTASAAELDVWIGTHKPRNGETAGIYRLTFDDETGELSRATLAAEQAGAGFLALHPSLSVLYSTGDGVSSWRIVGGAEGKRLERINDQPTGDGGTAHVAVDHTGNVLLSAQYGGGSVASYLLAADGSIGPRVSLVEHDQPSGVDANRQQSCHPHWVGMSPDNRFVIVPDLGADKIYVHRLDAKTAKLTEHGSVDAPPGGGPRHFKFHPSGRFGYLVNELTLTLSAFDWNDKAGELSLIQTIPVLNDEQKAGQDSNSGSEVRVHPEGKFVYSANRGHDTITAFSVDSSTGKLTLIEQEPIRGSWPRNFNLDPSGRWLLAAGRDSNTLAIFAIDQNTGALRFSLKTASVPAPICVLVAE
ncbi:lactonase family protein [Pirellulales bacterium]|nr:lactonase family protein [Pirellulales bacterium]